MPIYAYNSVVPNFIPLPQLLHRRHFDTTYPRESPDILCRSWKVVRPLKEEHDSHYRHWDLKKKQRWQENGAEKWDWRLALYICMTLLRIRIQALPESYFTLLTVNIRATNGEYNTVLSDSDDYIVDPATRMDPKHCSRWIKMVLIWKVKITELLERRACVPNSHSTVRINTEKTQD